MTDEEKEARAVARASNKKLVARANAEKAKLHFFDKAKVVAASAQGGASTAVTITVGEPLASPTTEVQPPELNRNNTLNVQAPVRQESLGGAFYVNIKWSNYQFQSSVKLCARRVLNAIIPCSKGFPTHPQSSNLVTFTVTYVQLDMSRSDERYATAGVDR